MPNALVDAIIAMNLSPLVVIGVLMVAFLILGSIFDTIAAMVITMPFVYPLVLGIGYDPIWWGIVLVMVIEIGMITPPIGMNVFVLYGVAKTVPLRTIFAGIVPFLCADLVRLAIIVLFPIITLWLPTYMGMNMGQN